MRVSALLLSLATLSVPALAQGTNPAVRDSFSALNYVQGQATLNGQPVTTDPTKAPQTLHAGDLLATTEGDADVMLAPGTLLRLGHDTAIRVVASDGNRAEARVENGLANVAVNVVRPSELVLVDLPEGQTQLLKRGLYALNAANNTVRVYDGEADAFPGADTRSAVKPLKVKDDHEVVLAEGKLHATSFDRNEADVDLLPWTGPQEAHADGVYGLAENGDGGGRLSANYYPAGYAVYGGPFAFGAGYPYAGFGWPYGFYDYPFGFYGGPFGYGLGFGYFGGGAFYGPGRVGHGYGGLGGVHPGFAGGGHGFAGGGFGGGGFHGGGGGGRR